MMDPAPTGGDGRRRGKKNRGNKGRRKRSGRGKGNRGKQQQKSWKPPETSRDDSSVLGGRVPRSSERKQMYDTKSLDAFALFCAYHLGITPDDGFHEPRLDDVARRFRLSPDELKKQLKKFGLDDKTARGSKFDFKSAKMDIRICPEGISRTESARELYDEFKELTA